MKIMTRLLLVLVLAGCSNLPGVHQLDLARYPDGIRVQVTLTRAWDRERVDGELLSVLDPGLLVLHRSTLVLCPWDRVKRVDFVDREFGPVRLKARAPAQKSREALSRVSRYPQGLSAEVRDALLRLHGQTAWITAGD